MNQATIHRCPRCREPLLTATLEASKEIIMVCTKCACVPVKVPGVAFVDLLKKHQPPEGTNQRFIIELR